MLFGLPLIDRHLERALTSERGVTIMELLVAITLFGIVGGSLALAMTNTIRDLGREYRLASATESVRMAMSVLSAELKMAAHASPYLPGINTDTVNCTASIEVDANSVRFLVATDDSSSANGLRATYVGYIYDPATSTLARGEVPATGTYSCTVPSSNPLALLARSPIAEKVIPIDYDEDGSVEPIFARDRTNLTVTMGIRVLARNGEFITQRLQSIIDIRNSNATS